MYGPASSYTQQFHDERNREFKRVRKQEEDERIAQRAAEILLEKLKEEEGK